MAATRSSWRALRPLLLAGAATAAWLTFSASAATADSTSDPGSLLGGATSSVSSLAAPLAQPAAAPLEGGSPPPPPSGLLEPVVGDVAGTADQLIAAAPVVGNVLPPDTVKAAAVPVVGVTESAAYAVIEAVAAPVVEALPVLEPALQPVVDLVHEAVPIVSATLTGPAADGIPIDSSASASTGAAAAESAAAAGEPADVAGNGVFLGLEVQAVSSTFVSASAKDHTVAPGNPWDRPNTPPAPAGPASGAANGASPSGPAAWLDESGISLPDSGSHPLSGQTPHAPSPVSFDPGSSPD